MSSSRVCAVIRRQLFQLFECSAGPSEGVVRVRTPFLYPDGGVVDVFVLSHQKRYTVTDFGEALGWLRTQSLRGRLSSRQQRLVEDVCLTLGVEFFKGQLVLRCDNEEALASLVVRLGQAVVRVSDLWFTLRTRAVETVSEEVTDWFQEKRIPFDRRVKHTGRSGRVWTVDFQARTVERTSLVFLLSTGSRAAARRITEHVVAGWHDLNHLKLAQPHVCFVSLFDDTEDVWREEDFRLLENLSEIVRWSRPDEFEQVLRAA